jgi:lipopolysaccharide export system permease protein
VFLRTVRRLLYRDIASSVALVALAFLALLFFIDFVEELSASGRRGVTLAGAVLRAGLNLPGHLYELAPIVLLIGTIYALSRMAQASEFTILRTAGLGPGQALRLLLWPGVVASLLTFALGEWVVPQAEHAGIVSAARHAGADIQIGSAGAWIKDSGGSHPQARHSAIHVASATADGELLRVRIFEFDDRSRLLRRIEAGRARVATDGRWSLVDASVADWPVTAPGHALVDGRHPGPADFEGHEAAKGTQAPRREGLGLERAAEFSWRGSLTPAVVGAAVMPLQTMSTPDLWRYSKHLASQSQAANVYEIRFWSRSLHPLACIVMAALALPFAYMHARAGGVSLKVFGGIMLGISFVLANHLSGHLGQLRDWTPWVAAGAPGLLYLFVSLASFWWLVRYR